MTDITEGFAALLVENMKPLNITVFVPPEGQVLTIDENGALNGYFKDFYNWWLSRANLM